MVLFRLCLLLGETKSALPVVPFSFAMDSVGLGASERTGMDRTITESGMIQSTANNSVL